MKHIFRLAIVAVIALTTLAACSTQTSGTKTNSISSPQGSSSLGGVAGDLVGDLISNLLGTNKLTDKNLVGTWTYSEPCTVLEGKNTLSQLGGTLITDQLEEQQKKLLEKIGFSAGKVKLVLNRDKSGTMTVGKRSLNLTWSVSESNLTLTILTRDIKMNANMDGGNLQIAMKADKFLELINSVVGKVGNTNSSFGSISKIMGNYDGLYLGLRFTKK